MLHYVRLRFEISNSMTWETYLCIASGNGRRGYNECQGIARTQIIINDYEVFASVARTQEEGGKYA